MVIENWALFKISFIKKFEFPLIYSLQPPSSRSQIQNLKIKFTRKTSEIKINVFIEKHSSESRLNLN